jgi:hypothetical protein
MSVVLYSKLLGVYMYIITRHLIALDSFMYQVQKIVGRVQRLLREARMKDVAEAFLSLWPKQIVFA